MGTAMNEIKMRKKHLGKWLSAILKARDVHIPSMERLPGGVTEKNWQLSLSVSDGHYAGSHDWIMLSDAALSVGISHDRHSEFELLSHVYKNNIMAPKPLFFCSDLSVIGHSFYLMIAKSGSAEANRMIKHVESPLSANKLVAQLGEQLAYIHKIVPESNELMCLDKPEKNSACHQIEMLRSCLDQLDKSHPVLEYGLNWVEDKIAISQKSTSLVLCHRDFRPGNFLIENGQLSAILDWKSARWSDRHEDIGWLCARSWQLNNPSFIVGGIAPFAEFKKAYERIAGISINIIYGGYWQIMAEIRRAIICLQQAARNDNGEEISLEFSLAGHMAPEMEYHMLSLIEEMETGKWRDLE